MEYTSITSPPATKAEIDRYRRFVSTLACAHCGIEGYTQVAHSNDYDHGKGKGLKAHWLAEAPLCHTRPSSFEGASYRGCHELYDSGHRLSQEQFNEYIIQTLISAANAGKLKVK